MPMAKPSSAPGFKALQKEWYKRLADLGFEDIEMHNIKCQDGNIHLKNEATAYRFQKMDPIQREAKAQYFRKVYQYCASAIFENETERKILNLYAQGVSQAVIQKTLGIEGHRCHVYEPIYKWLTRWGLK